MAETFASNWIAPLGPQVDAFEKEVAEYVGVKGALALSSGTAAIHLALRYLGVGPGDLLFASSLTFIGSVNPILYRGSRAGHCLDQKDHDTRRLIYCIVQ